MEASEQPQDQTSRRSFLLKGAAVGVASLGAGGLLLEPSEALAKGRPEGGSRGGLTKATPRFSSSWPQRSSSRPISGSSTTSFAGIQDSEVPGGSGNPAYHDAVTVLDGDMDQYIHDNTDDEISHAAFINAYLKAHGKQTVNLDKFRTLPSSKPQGRSKSEGSRI